MYSLVTVYIYIQEKCVHSIVLINLMHLVCHYKYLKEKSLSTHSISLSQDSVTQKPLECGHESYMKAKKDDFLNYIHCRSVVFILIK